MNCVLLDIVFGTYQDDEAKAAEAHMEIKRVDFTGIPVSDLERLDGVVGGVTEALGYEGYAEAALGEEEDHDDDELDPRKLSP